MPAASSDLQVSSTAGCFRHLFPSDIDSRRRHSAMGVLATGGVAVPLRHPRSHVVQHYRIQRRSGVKIEIYRQFEHWDLWM